VNAKSIPVGFFFQTSIVLEPTLVVPLNDINLFGDYQAGPGFVGAPASLERTDNGLADIHATYRSDQMPSPVLSFLHMSSGVRLNLVGRDRIPSHREDCSAFASPSLWLQVYALRRQPFRCPFSL
jgi:hypothetical protein